MLMYFEKFSLVSIAGETRGKKGTEENRLRNEKKK
jgi:hypothetical protein